MSNNNSNMFLFMLELTVHMDKLATQVMENIESKEYGSAEITFEQLKQHSNEMELLINEVKFQDHVEKDNPMAIWDAKAKNVENTLAFAGFYFKMKSVNEAS